MKAPRRPDAGRYVRAIDIKTGPEGGGVAPELGAGTAATGCRSCVLFGAKTRRFEAGRGGHVNTLNTNRPIDAELAS